MKKVVRLTEAELARMVKNIISEQGMGSIDEQPSPNQDIDLYASECLQDKDTFKLINAILDSAKSNTPVGAAFKALNTMIPGNPNSERLKKELMLLGNCIGLKNSNDFGGEKI